MFHKAYIYLEEIIEFSKSIRAKIGIQKYEIYRYSRKMKGAKADNWWKLYRKLSLLEKKHGVQLRLSKKDFDIFPAERIPTKMEVGKKVNAKVVAPGWINGQMIAVANHRCITVNDCSAETGKTINIKILENKNNIYVAE